MCQCGAELSADSEFCRSCGRTCRVAEETCTCGAAFSTDSKFCRFCGQTRSREEKCYCGAVLSSDSKFCRFCGNPRCQSGLKCGCGAVFNSDSRFCVFCGQPRPDQICVCGVVFSKDSTVCRSCGQARRDVIRECACGASLCPKARFCRRCGTACGSATAQSSTDWTRLHSQPPPANAVASVSAFATASDGIDGRLKTIPGAMQSAAMGGGGSAAAWLGASRDSNVVRNVAQASHAFRPCATWRTPFDYPADMRQGQPPMQSQSFEHTADVRRCPPPPPTPKPPLIGDSLPPPPPPPGWSMGYDFDQPKVHRVSGPASAASTKPQTTLMVRNIPLQYTQEMLVDQWLRTKWGYDFLYLPVSSNPQRNLTFVFINFLNENFAAAFSDAWHRQRLPLFQARKSLNISPATTQGRDDNVVDIWRNSVRSIRERHCEPVIFEGNVRLKLLDAVHLAHQRSQHF